MNNNPEQATQTEAAQPEKQEALVFVNWMKARNLRGFFGMYRLIPTIYAMLRRAKSYGLLESRLAIVGPREFVVISYWENEAALRAAFQDEGHVQMMRYIFKNHQDLDLGNETYTQPISTRYLNDAGGYSLAQPQS